MSEQTDDHIDETINIIKTHLRGVDDNKVFATSSFQTQSVPLLHIISQHFPYVTILFLDTGFLFPETYAFKNNLEKKFNLKVKTLKSETTLLQQLDGKTAHFQYVADPDRCCYINKVKPLNDFLSSGDSWISGVRRDQTATRKKMDIVEQTERGIIKLHPMLHWNSRLIYHYIRDFDLPKHPLENEGYISIGCVPCTHKYIDGDERGGRWEGRSKTECGLHK